MEDQNIIQDPQVVEPDNNQYISAIRDLKANSVSREQYERLKGENAALLQSLIDGNQITPVADEALKTSAEIRKEIWCGEPIRSQTEYVSKLLELREAVLREGESDPFVFSGHMVQPTRESYETAQRTADVYRECLDIAQGNDLVFAKEIELRLNDTPMANNIYNNQFKRR